MNKSKKKGQASRQFQLLYISEVVKKDVSYVEMVHACCEQKYRTVPPLRNYIFQNSPFHFLYKEILQKSDFIYQHTGNWNIMENCYQNVVLGI